MSKFAQMLKIAGMIAGVVALGVVFGLLATRGGSSGNKGSAAQPSPDGAGNTPSGPAATPNIPRVLEHKQPLEPVQNPAMTEETPSKAAENLITNWDEKIDAILSAEGDDADKAKLMLALFPHLPEDGQVEVAQHLSNLTADKDYAPLGAYLTNSATPEAVQDVLMADLLNRPNSVKLPLLLDVARDAHNPKAGEAKDILELFLEEDYGTDWPQWQNKMQQWLADNPD